MGMRREAPLLGRAISGLFGPWLADIRSATRLVDSITMEARGRSITLRDSKRHRLSLLCTLAAFHMGSELVQCCEKL